MILAFEFTYLSHNGVLENLLKQSCVENNIKHLITRENTCVTLYVEENEERLGAFADALSASLPLSLFFKSSSVYVAESFPAQEESIPLLNIPVVFTPSKITSIETPSSPLYLLPYSTFNVASDTLSLFKEGEKVLEASSSEAFEEVYALLTTALSEGKTVQVKTASGLFVLGRIENAKQLPSMENVEVLPTDLSVVERMVVIRENEIKALATLERPSIRCKVNAMFAQKEILPTERVCVRLADEWLVYHVCKRLFAQGVSFLFKAPATLLKADVCVVTSLTLPAIEPLQVSVLENGEIILVKGKSYASKTLLENTKKFEEPSHGAFASIMQEHHLFDAKSSCFYLSKLYDDKLMNYSSEHGMLNLTSVPLPSSFEALFDEIAQNSESSARLIENYKNTYPEMYAQALHVKIPETLPKSIYSLWKIIAVVLGFSSDLDKGAEVLIELAEDFGGQKGPRMDYFLQKEEALVSDMNYIKLIRSGMSFKLAGTDDATLAFGYVQSLAHFISDMSDYYKENLLNEKIALAGSLFGFRRFSEMVYKNLKPNHPICFNKELPIELNA